MPRRSPGAKAKGLGRELRILRERAGKKQSDGAKALDVSVQVFSRLESGQRNISEEEVITLLAVYGVTGAKRDQLLMMVRTLDDPGWWEHTMPGLTPTLATLVDYEERATRVISWAPLLVPGLLQTMKFSREYMLADGIAPGEVEARLTTRARRQARLQLPTFRYEAIICEPALHGFDREVAIEQFDALLAASARPNVSIRIILNDTMRYRGRIGGFLALELPDEESIVHIELARSSVVLDEADLTKPYFETLAQVSELALSETESAQWISHRKARWRAD